MRIGLGEMKYTVDVFEGIQEHTDLPSDVSARIEACIESAFGGGITQEDAQHHMTGDQVLVVHNDNEVLGFSSTSIASPFEIYGRDGLSDLTGAYFCGAAVRRGAQSHGIYRDMNARRLDFGLSNGAEVVFTRTQNPRVEEGITHSIEEKVRRRDIKGFELSKVVSIGAYGKMLTDIKPVGRNIVYDELDYARGDGLIISWRLLK